MNTMARTEFDRAINASDLQEWIMEVFPDWCEGDIRLIYDHIDDMPTVTINDLADEIKVTNCNYNQFAEDSKKVSISWDHENDLIHREDALNCFHDWIDQRGDVHTADEMPEYQRIEQLTSTQPKRTDKRTETHACDLISRRAAIDVVAKWFRQIDLNPDICIDSIISLPSVQPDTCENTCEIERKSNDMISRQDAIDACIRVREYHAYDEIEEIKALPSAQPEIIRCKDCKHKYLDDMVWNCPFGLPDGEDFFCAYGVKDGDSDDE